MLKHVHTQPDTCSEHAHASVAHERTQTCTCSYCEGTNARTRSWQMQAKVEAGLTWAGTMYGVVTKDTNGPATYARKGTPL